MSLSMHQLPAFKTELTAAANGYSSSCPAAPKGIISEVVYSEENPGLTQYMLLPLLQQLGQQSRWQLWMTPHHKPDRQWFSSSGLPVDKIMHANFRHHDYTLTSMEKALRSGNFSAVVCWSSQPLTEDEHSRLSSAAAEGHAMGLIMRAEGSYRLARPLSGLKIHSGLYH